MNPRQILMAGLILGLLFFADALSGRTQEDRLPPVKTDGSRLSTVGEIRVNEYRFKGNTVFPDPELAEVLAPYSGRVITAEELQEAREAVTRYYVDRGYVNSGAIIPDQPVAGGVITLRVIEGRIIRMEIEGNRRLRTGYLARRLAPAVSPEAGPLNIRRIQEHLRLLKQDPRVENIHAEVSPGLGLGEAVLTVTVEEARPYILGVSAGNENSPKIGAHRGEVRAGHRNLTGWGDTLRAEYGVTEGLDDWAVSYTIPLTRRETTLAVGVERSESAVVEDPFRRLDIRSKTTTYSAEIRHPFHRTLSNEFSMGLRLERRRSETSLLGEGFSFSEGVPETGESEISVLRFSQQWVDRSLTHVLALRSAFGFGLDLFDATIDPDKPDGRFITWLGQVQWLRRFETLDSQVLFRTDLRLSDDPLLPMEKFGVGGATTVRGYRENQMTTDNALVSSLEWRVPVFRAPLPGVSRGAADGRVRLCPFVDYGRGWNSQGTDPSPADLYSAGLGARWDISGDVRANLYWGYGFKEVPEPEEEDLQDDGFHFEVSAEFF